MPKAILPKVFDISRMFASPRHTYPAYPLEEPVHVSGIAGTDHSGDGLGFPEGSTILISGPPGSGKSTFSLAMVRSLFFQDEPNFTFRPGADNGGAGGVTENAAGRDVGQDNCWMVVYISPEIDRERLNLHFGQFGWFHSNDHFFDRHGENFTALRVSERELERPFLGADELVNVVFSELKAFHANPRYERRKVVVVVDSLTSVLKDSPTPGEWRRQTHDFIHRLRELLGKRLALAILLSERMESSPTEVPTEEHVADIVLQLSVKKTGSGHVLRCANVIKSRGVFMNLGEHTWAILTRDNIGRVIGESSLILDLGLYLDRQEGTSTFCEADLANGAKPLLQHLKKSSTRFDNWLKQRLVYSKELLEAKGLGSLGEDHCNSLILKDLNRICKNGSLFEAARALGIQFSSTTTEIQQLDSIDRQPDRLNRCVIADAYPKFVSLPAASNGSSGCPQESANSYGTPLTWATIGIFPRPRLPSIGRQTVFSASPVQPAPPIATGVPGLDEMLLGIEQTAPIGGQLDASSRCRGLSVGSTTLVVGGSGTGKTGFCMGFCKAGASWSEGLYVNFENDPNRLRDYHRLELDSDSSAADCLNTIYRRRGNLDVNLLLAEIKYVIQYRGIRRIAIDGLSDLLSTTTEGEYSRFVETLLEWIRFWGKAVEPTKSPERITLMVTFEIDANLHLLPQTHGLSLTADNVIILKQIKLNDQLHRAIYVPKVRGQNHSRQVREVISVASIGPATGRRDAVVSIQPGFESYVDVLSERPERIEFNLQLFQENQAEALYNKELANGLHCNLGFEFNLFRFTNSEITRALCDHLMRKPGVIPPTDVRIITVDEWWVRECSVDAQSGIGSGEFIQKLWNPWLELRKEPARGAGTIQLAFPSTNYPLYSFTSTVSARLSVPETGAEEADRDLLRQFWHFEVEKGLAIVPKQWPADLDPTKCTLPVQAELLALPYIMDYGMFCANGGCLSVDDSQTVKSAPGSVRFDGPKSLNNPVRKALVDAFGKIEWIWATPKIVYDGAKTVGWWESPTKEQLTVLGVAEKMKAQRGESLEYSVVFDAATPESGVCFLLELLWALGGSEDALVPFETEPLHRPHDAAPLASALRFLAFLVLESCMPPRPRVEDSKRSVFSRHWYSTLVKEHMEARDADADGGTVPRPVAIPDFPGFPQPSADKEERERGIRLHRRLDSALGLGATEFASSNVKLLPRDATKSTSDVLLGIRNEPRIKTLLASPRRTLGEISSLTALNVHSAMRDRGDAVMELAAAVALDERDLEILGAAQRRREAMIRREPLNTAPNGKEVRFVQGVTGFCAAGSWLVGVKAPAHSPKLSWDVLKEMTSLREATVRAERGAGLPARKDFMEFRGSEAARYAEHLSWRELMVACLSRARRRDRVIPAGIHGLPIYSDLHREMLAILNLAGELKSAYASNGGRLKAIKEIDQAANDAVRRIAEHLQTIQRQVNEKAARKRGGEL